MRHNKIGWMGAAAIAALFVCGDAWAQVAKEVKPVLTKLNVANTLETTKTTCGSDQAGTGDLRGNGGWRPGSVNGTVKDGKVASLLRPHAATIQESGNDRLTKSVDAEVLLSKRSKAADIKVDILLVTKLRSNERELVAKVERSGQCMRRASYCFVASRHGKTQAFAAPELIIAVEKGERRLSGHDLALDGKHAGSRAAGIANALCHIAMGDGHAAERAVKALAVIAAREAGGEVIIDVPIKDREIAASSFDAGEKVFFSEKEPLPTGAGGEHVLVSDRKRVIFGVAVSATDVKSAK